jgi:hypothetical protein
MEVHLRWLEAAMKTGGPILSDACASQLRLDPDQEVASLQERLRSNEELRTPQLMYETPSSKSSSAEGAYLEREEDVSIQGS